MRNIVVAAIIAAGSVCSPIVLVTSSPAMAVDCSNPADPGNRPGGYCSLTAPGGSLSSPVSSTGDCSMFVSEADATQYIRHLDYGMSVLVACNDVQLPVACESTQT